MSEIQPQVAVAENVNKSKKRRNRGGKKKIKSTTEATNIPIVIQPPKLKSIQKESISSNWKSLLQTMPVSDKKKPFPRQSKKNDISPFKRLKLSEEKKSSEEKSEEPEVWFDGVDSSLIDVVHKHKSSSEDPQSDLVKKGFTGVTRILAMDCEMVGTGVGGSSSIVARVSIVNHFGSVVYDTFVSPTEEVTDFRTSVSGVRPHHLKGAPS
jgi:RNA exonuclease 4